MNKPASSRYQTCLWLFQAKLWGIYCHWTRVFSRGVLKSKQKQWRRHGTGNKSHKSEAISNEEISSMLNRPIYIVQSNWIQHTKQHFTNSFAILFTLARGDVLNIVPCVVVTLFWRRVKLAKKIQKDKVKLGPVKTVEMSVQWNLKFDPT